MIDAEKGWELLKSSDRIEKGNKFFSEYAVKWIDVGDEKSCFVGSQNVEFPEMIFERKAVQRHETEEINIDE
jgi:hypothetical protein